MSPAAAGSASLTPRPTLVQGQGDAVEAEYASDHWDARRLGVPARRGRTATRFDTITQPWLRDPVKRWSRFRLATGCAFTTIGAGAASWIACRSWRRGRRAPRAGKAWMTWGACARVKFPHRARYSGMSTSATTHRSSRRQPCPRTARSLGRGQQRE
jgi:hypothetical protein